MGCFIGVYVDSILQMVGRALGLCLLGKFSSMCIWNQFYNCKVYIIIATTYIIRLLGCTINTLNSINFIKPGARRPGACLVS